MDSKYSIVEFEYTSNKLGGSCGYCKSSSKSFSTGMWAFVLTVDDYQDLIDRGWRRSGQYCYKPNMEKTCCPSYTIKCDALNLKLSKTQKKLLKKITKYINGEEVNFNRDPGDGESDSGSEPEHAGSNIFDKRIHDVHEQKLSQPILTLTEVHSSLDGGNSTSRHDENTTSKAVTEERDIVTDVVNIDAGDQPDKLGTPEKRSLRTPTPGIGRDISKPQCKKAKLLRLERKQKKLAERGLDINISKKEANSEKSLEEFLHGAMIENPVNKLELKLVRSFPRSEEFEETFKEEHSLYQRYQMAIHKDPITRCTENQFTRFLVNSPVQPKIRLLPSNSGKEILKESWKLYAKYQMSIHKDTPDECGYQAFYSFLVASPLQAVTRTGGPSCGFGSFHQQYWLNGKLIAVGVIDVLPNCVSSVYFFYDPDYLFLSLGTYGSLRELEFTRKLNQECPEISSYYMGFYIHTCPKMRYKARYSPSYLLCPDVYTWHLITDCLAKLDQNKYCRFNDDLNAVCENSTVSIDRVLVLWKHIAMPYLNYKMRVKSLKDGEDVEVEVYGSLIGRKCAERMLLYRP